MKSAKVFAFEYHLDPGSATSAPSPGNSPAELAEALRQAAKRGWRIFPVIPQEEYARGVTAHVGEATSDTSCIKEWATEHPLCMWHVEIGPASDLCVLSVSGMHGMSEVRIFCLDDSDRWDSHTLRSQAGGDHSWALCKWPEGLVMRTAEKRLEPGLDILGHGSCCTIHPSTCSCGQCIYVDAKNEIAAVPKWLVRLGFDQPGGYSAITRPVPKVPPRKVESQTVARFVKPGAKGRKGYPVCGQGGWRGGFRISRQSQRKPITQCDLSRGRQLWRLLIQSVGIPSGCAGAMFCRAINRERV